MSDSKIQAITMPGVHNRFLEFFRQKGEATAQRVLDLGAGQGALTQRLHQMDFEVEACDLFPEYYKYHEVPFNKVDVTEAFPYEDERFDLVIAVEVTEHILDHENFFREINRILKPGGRLYISTPNILSMKSRFRFLFQGFPYAFKPLEMDNRDGLQHVASLSLDQYNYLARKHGFLKAEYAADRKQRTSRILYALFLPLIWMAQIGGKSDPLHNEKTLLTGRLLFLIFTKK